MQFYKILHYCNNHLVVVLLTLISVSLIGIAEVVQSTSEPFSSSNKKAHPLTQTDSDGVIHLLNKDPLDFAGGHSRARRGKGYGSVSRVALNPQGEDGGSIDLLDDLEKFKSLPRTEPEIVSFDTMPKRPFMEIIMPTPYPQKTLPDERSFVMTTSTTSMNNNTEEPLTTDENDLNSKDYEKLAKVLKAYANKKLAHVTKEVKSDSFSDEHGSKEERPIVATIKPNIDTISVFTKSPLLKYLLTLPTTTTTSSVLNWNGTVEKIVFESRESLFSEEKSSAERLINLKEGKKMIKVRPQIGRVLLQQDTPKNNGEQKATLSAFIHQSATQRPPHRQEQEDSLIIVDTKSVKKEPSSDKAMGESRPKKPTSETRLQQNLTEPKSSQQQNVDRSNQADIALSGNSHRKLQINKIPTNGNDNHQTKATVHIIREGFARQTESDEYVFVASITLILDAGKTILVDTGQATDVNGRTDLIDQLSKLNIAPPSIDYVVTTHDHPDHNGNINDFPDSIHFQGSMSLYRLKFNLTDLFEKESHQLTSNVHLLRTPGHTSEDISVMVLNADVQHQKMPLQQKYGTLIVAGDTFFAAEDFDFPMMWRPLAWNETAQEESRRKILCLADYIVPGHGTLFRVTPAMLSQVNCP